MALNSNEKPKYAVTPKNSVGVLNAASAGTLGSDTNGVAIYTAGTNGGRVNTLMISSDDTVAVNVFLYILSGATVMPLGIINVPINSGNALNVLNVDALDSSVLKGTMMDNTGKRFISLAPNEVLKMTCLAAMTAAKKLHGSAQGADY